MLLKKGHWIHGPKFSIQGAGGQNANLPAKMLKIAVFRPGPPQDVKNFHFSLQELQFGVIQELFGPCPRGPQTSPMYPLYLIGAWIYNFLTPLRGDFKIRHENLFSLFEIDKAILRKQLKMTTLKKELLGLKIQLYLLFSCLFQH